jgi:hypothetical protein
MDRNNQKTGFYAVLFFILGPFGHPQLDPKRYSKAHKWMGGMAQIIMPIHLDDMVRNNQKTGFYVVFFFLILGPFGHPQMDSKRYPMACKWARAMAQCLSLKISPKPNY